MTFPIPLNNYTSCTTMLTNAYNTVLTINTTLNTENSTIIYNHLPPVLSSSNFIRRKILSSFISIFISKLSLLLFLYKQRYLLILRYILRTSTYPDLTHYVSVPSVVHQLIVTKCSFKRRGKYYLSYQLLLISFAVTVSEKHFCLSAQRRRLRKI